jgi:hypothetical protein
MYLSQEKAVLALQLLIEGNSIRSTMRISGVDGNTIRGSLKGAIAWSDRNSLAVG